jgi:hypothetical protein
MLASCNLRTKEPKRCCINDVRTDSPGNSVRLFIMQGAGKGLKRNEEFAEYLSVCLIRTRTSSSTTC